ncbi:MAG TPA: nitronate monooxygenase [Terriglobales bacterium]|nr:nitronate monooxygenase [Terriglobales bacterium]
MEKHALHTPLCDLLGVRYPLVQAPMSGGPTTPELVAAVCEAGGFGVLAAFRVAPEDVRKQIRAVRERTDRPFGVNVLLAPPEPGNRDAVPVQQVLNHLRRELKLPEVSDAPALPPSQLQQQIQVILEERVPVLSTAMGDPTPLVEPAHAAGAKVMAMVTTVAEAQAVAGAGVDIVLAQGAEAGGHRSTFRLGPDGEAALVGTMALVPQVADAVRVPVVAAGGIADGRGLVASLALGAAGAAMGTRFLVARESAAFPAYKQRVLEADEAATVVTRAFTGRPARGIHNRVLDALLAAKVEPLAWPLQALAAGDLYARAIAAGDADLYPLLTGQAVRLLKSDQGAAEIVAEIVAQAEATLAQLAGHGPRS